MADVLIILQQVAIMLILAVIGYLMFKTGKISSEGSKALGNILIFLSLPCVIINGFLVDRTPERITGLFISAALAAVVLVMSAWYRGCSWAGMLSRILPEHFPIRASSACR